jgi:hypothetical protein
MSQMKIKSHISQGAVTLSEPVRACLVLRCRLAEINAAIAAIDSIAADDLQEAASHCRDAIGSLTSAAANALDTVQVEPYRPQAAK